MDEMQQRETTNSRAAPYVHGAMRDRTTTPGGREGFPTEVMQAFDALADNDARERAIRSVCAWYNIPLERLASGAREENRGGASLLPPPRAQNGGAQRQGPGYEARETIEDDEGSAVPVAQAAKMLGINNSSTYAAIDKGQLRTIISSSGKKLVPMGAIEEYRNRKQ